MLLENDHGPTLNFEINNNLTLRAFIGDKLFRELILSIVEQNRTDMNSNIILLDKIKEQEKVLLMFIKIQKTQIDQNKP